MVRVRRFKSKVLACSVPLSWVSMALDVLYLQGYYRNVPLLAASTLVRLLATVHVHIVDPMHHVQYTTCTAQHSS